MKITLLLLIPVIAFAMIPTDTVLTVNTIANAIAVHPDGDIVVTSDDGMYINGEQVLTYIIEAVTYQDTNIVYITTSRYWPMLMVLGDPSGCSFDLRIGRQWRPSFSGLTYYNDQLLFINNGGGNFSGFWSIDDNCQIQLVQMFSDVNEWSLRGLFVDQENRVWFGWEERRFADSFRAMSRLNFQTHQVDSTISFEGDYGLLLGVACPNGDLGEIYASFLHDNSQTIVVKFKNSMKFQPDTTTIRNSSSPKAADHPEKSELQISNPTTTSRLYELTRAGKYRMWNILGREMPTDIPVRTAGLYLLQEKKVPDIIHKIFVTR